MRAFLLALTMVTLSACGGPQRAAPPDALDDPALVLEGTLDRLSLLDAARLRAELEYYGRDGRARVEQVVLVREPGDVRIETLSPFGTTLTVFTLSGDALQFWDLQAERFIVGASRPEHIGLFIPFALSAADVVRVLLGAPPLDRVAPDPDRYTLSWDARRAAYRLRMPLAEGDGELSVWVKHETYTLVAAREVDGEGRVVFELRAGRFERERVGDAVIEVPGRLEFEMPREGVDISLDLTAAEWNPSLVDALFELREPRGVTVEVLP